MLGKYINKNEERIFKLERASEIYMTKNLHFIAVSTAAVGQTHCFSMRQYRACNENLFLCALHRCARKSPLHSLTSVSIKKPHGCNLRHLCVY